MHKLTILLALIALPFAAHADSVDCSDATHYNSDHAYKRGDLVWLHDGGNVYLKYKCIRDTCNNDSSESDKNGHDQPGAFQKTKAWQDIGMCKDTPH
jgi:hypothetical protein